MAEGKPFIKCGELFDFSDAFCNTPELEELFDAAINEALRWHITRCSDYKLFLAENGLVDFKQVYSSDLIPPLLIDIFNKYKIVSIPEKLIKLELAAADVKKRKTPIIYDARTYKRITKITENIFASLGLVQHNQKVNYLCLYADPKYEQLNEVSFSERIITDLTAHRSVFYAVKPDKELLNFSLDIEAAAKKLIDFSCHTEPIRIIGSSLNIKRLYSWFKEHNVEIKLGNKSFIFINDLWKNFNNPNDEYSNLKELLEKMFGISKRNIRDMFGVIEHGIPYVECEEGHFHIPAYSKVFAMEPELLSPVENGEEGLLCLVSPFITSFPSISVLTDYTAEIQQNCPCGRNSNYFIITGKAEKQNKVKESIFYLSELLQ